MFHYFTENDLTASNQSGFKPKTPPSINLTKYINLLDISKVFDKKLV